MTLRIILADAPSDADREAIIAPLRAYNESRAGDGKIRPVALMLTDAQGRNVGGLWGRLGYDWLFVELLVVPEGMRGGGYGTALMREAEQLARANDCIGVWLDTFEFQARGFYEKLGYELFGTLVNHPAGQRRYFLSKRI